MLPVCGQRKPAAAALAMGRIQQRAGRWCIVERARTPARAVYRQSTPANIKEGGWLITANEAIRPMEAV